MLSEDADVIYACSFYYEPGLEGGIHHAEPDVGIAWPEGLELVPSERDTSAPLLRDVADRLPFEFRR